METDQERFERGFVALSYLLGRRSSDLTSPLGSLNPSVLRVARRLDSPDRRERAEALASELGRVVASLESWRLT